jgi:hypothetical protein
MCRQSAITYGEFLRRPRPAVRQRRHPTQERDRKPLEPFWLL